MDKSLVNIKKEDFLLKSSTSIFKCQLNKTEINKDIKKVIDGYGDRQNHLTNVKAQMTDVKMWNEPGFKDLGNIVLDICRKISKNNKLIFHSFII